MKSFFASLLYAAVIGGISASLAGKAYQKHLRGFTALLCAALLVSPILKLLPEFKLPFPAETELSAGDTDAADDLVVRQSAADAENALKRCIFSETGIKPISVLIDIESRGEVLYLAGLRVKTNTQAEASTVREFLKRLFKEGVPTEVTGEDKRAD